VVSFITSVPRSGPDLAPLARLAGTGLKVFGSNLGETDIQVGEGRRLPPGVRGTVADLRG
jgi:hypothetical protein